MPRKGFTVAEVLITIAIIGIVAIMTIPSLKKNADRDAVVQKLQKNYGVLTNIVNMAVAQNGQIESWDLPDKRDGEAADKVFQKYFAPQLKLIKYCGTGTGCWPNDTYKFCNGADYTNLNTIDERTKGILADGTLISFRTGSCKSVENSECGAFYVDVNGFKGPNRVGYDMFEIWFYPSGIEMPYTKGSLVSSADEGEFAKPPLSDEEIDSICKARGWSCSTKIAREGWKITYW